MAERGWRERGAIMQHGDEDVGGRKQACHPAYWSAVSSDARRWAAKFVAKASAASNGAWTASRLRLARGSVGGSGGTAGTAMKGHAAALLLRGVPPVFEWGW